MALLAFALAEAVSVMDVRGFVPFCPGSALFTFGCRRELEWLKHLSRSMPALCRRAESLRATRQFGKAGVRGRRFVVSSDFPSWTLRFDPGRARGGIAPSEQRARGSGQGLNAGRPVMADPAAHAGLGPPASSAAATTFVNGGPSLVATLFRIGHLAWSALRGFCGKQSALYSGAPGCVGPARVPPVTGDEPGDLWAPDSSPPTACAEYDMHGLLGILCGESQLARYRLGYLGLANHPCMSKAWDILGFRSHACFIAALREVLARPRPSSGGPDRTWCPNLGLAESGVPPLRAAATPRGLPDHGSTFPPSAPAGGTSATRPIPIGAEAMQLERERPGTPLLDHAISRPPSCAADPGGERVQPPWAPVMVPLESAFLADDRPEAFAAAETHARAAAITIGEAAVGLGDLTRDTRRSSSVLSGLSLRHGLRSLAVSPSSELALAPEGPVRGSLVPGGQTPDAEFGWFAHLGLHSPGRGSVGSADSSEALGQLEPRRLLPTSETPWQVLPGSSPPRSLGGAGTLPTALPWEASGIVAPAAFGSDGSGPAAGTPRGHRAPKRDRDEAGHGACPTAAKLDTDPEEGDVTPLDASSAADDGLVDQAPGPLRPGIAGDVARNPKQVNRGRKRG